MKAIVLSETGGPDKLLVQDVVTPIPGPGQVRVHLQAAALNRRDFWICKGLYPNIELPSVLGADGAGTIESVGAGVDNKLIGNEVIIFPAYNWGDDARFSGEDYRILGMPAQGTFAEYICVPRENVNPKPAHLDWEQTASISLAGLTAWRAIVTKAGLRQGQKVLITGIGGGVATMCLLLALGLGAEVYVSSSSDEKIERAKALGAKAGVNYTHEDWHVELRALCGGVDVVIDGNVGPAFQPCLKSLNPAGRYIIYGATQGNPPQGMNIAQLFFRQIRVEGTTMGTSEEFAAMLQFVSDKKIEPVIDKVFDFEDAVAAHEYIGAGTQMGKIVLRHV